MDKSKITIIGGIVAILAFRTTTVVVKVNHSHLIEAQAFYDSAMKHYMAREYEAELADLNKAIELNPKFAEALFSRGCLYGGDLPEKQRDYTKAVMDYTHLLKIEPQNVSIWHNRALAYESLHEYDKAIADYTTIIKGNMDYSNLVNGKNKQLALDYHYRGRAHQWYKKDYVKAIADYDQALRLDPKIEMVHQHRGQCYEALKQFDKAKEDFDMEKAR